MKFAIFLCNFIEMPRKKRYLITKARHKTMFNSSAMVKTNSSFENSPLDFLNPRFYSHIISYVPQKLDKLVDDARSGVVTIVKSNIFLSYFLLGKRIKMWAGIKPPSDEERNLAHRISYIKTIATEGAEDILRYGNLMEEDKEYIRSFENSNLDELNAELANLRNQLYHNELAL
ncbi:hypothetical protein [Ferruginibacter sp. HRS2-29]|uniref:hypothetical protein n=1 Tax=Ferruginibacter sp. HRS2-29 TaxID=2487334 RepID=UPI0020CB8FD2|nr:hypothetical protein [Ferruginibacter sp. HRS2-29]MCP9749991.1 hypothetical protein [Ferruginibacter sp. HRS2-29]